MPSQSQPQIVVLTGFMGSGKSTVGRQLAARLGWTFQDLDALVEEADGRSVARIFAESGESAFRMLETAALRRALEGRQAVLALGGGAPEIGENRALLANAGEAMVVFLDATFPTLAVRCATGFGIQEAVRPLFADQAAAAARYVVRRPFYEEVAHRTIETDGHTEEQTVAAALSLIAASIAAE